MTMDTLSPAKNTNGHWVRTQRRPRRVTLLALGVLILAGSNAFRAAGALRAWDFLAQMQAVSPLYQAVTGSFWAAAGLVLFWMLWRGSRRAPLAVLAFSVAYSLYFWVDRLAVAVTDEPFSAWPFAVVLSVLLLGLVYWIVTRPRARAYFNRR